MCVRVCACSHVSVLCVCPCDSACVHVRLCGEEDGASIIAKLLVPLFILYNLSANLRNQSFCNNATWADEKWSGNTVPGLELDSPVRKDTVNVPTGGYVIVRIKADNPGGVVNALSRFAAYGGRHVPAVERILP